MDNIMQEVERYLKAKKTDYALQINGPWGIGKTYYVLNELKPFIEKQTNNETKENYKLVYVSLNGVKHTDDIGEMIFLEITGKGGKIAYALTKAALKVGQGVFRQFGHIFKGTEEYIKEKGHSILDLSNVVLCFDDLERISGYLSIEQVLGYINTNFVEHNFVKQFLFPMKKKYRINDL
ncbi:P-loop NTPase fold protein [Thermolongibacillus altinsuensis]